MLLDGINRQEFISDRIPMPVDIVSDTAYINSITGETVSLLYFANAYLTCGTAGTTVAATWAALAATTKFEIDIGGKTYVVNPDFTGDTDMDEVAASIQTAIRTATGGTETCTQGTNIFTITVAKDESGEGMANSISVLRNTATNTGANIAGATWMNGLYGTGVVTPATLTTDAGQAAGTIVMAKLNYTGILDSLGAMIGNEKDTSFAWTTNTVLPKKYLKEFPKFSVERLTNKELVDIAYEIGKNLTTNGEWCLDHRTGVIVGRKATTGTSDTGAYKVQTQTTGGGTSIAATVKVSDGTDILDVLVQDAAFGTASKGLAVFGKYQATPTTYTDGDAVPIKMDAQGAVYVKDATLGTDVVTLTATGSAAINSTTAVAAEFKIIAVTCHFSAAPTTSENFVIKLDATAGAAYDTTLYSVNPSLSAATDIAYIPDGELKFKANDEVVVTFTNTNARTYGLSVYYQLI